MTQHPSIGIKLDKFAEEKDIEKKIRFRKELIERIDIWFENGGVPTCYKVPDMLGNVVKSVIPDDFKMKVFKLFIKLADFKLENKDMITIQTMQSNSAMFFGEGVKQKQLVKQIYQYLCLKEPITKGVDIQKFYDFCFSIWRTVSVVLTQGQNCLRDKHLFLLHLRLEQRWRAYVCRH